MGSQEERTGGKAAAGRPSEVVDCGRGQAVRQLARRSWWADGVGRVPCLCVGKPGGTVPEQDRPHNAEFQPGKRKPQNLWL